ncbi:MAG: inositol monophosphatase [Gammaproteobacteria bacterium]|nr:inositol monophosphatase [Gammaproteobacteria bacterium]
MHPMVNIALRASRDAADSLAHHVGRLDRLRIINEDPNHFLTSADQESEQTLIYHIRKTYPDHIIDSRVSGLHEGDSSSPIWLLDPLLSNINFATGYTRFGVAIAIRIKDRITHAVISSPLQNDEFIASRGQGAQLNSRRIRVTDKSRTSDLIGLDASGQDSKVYFGLQEALFRGGASPRVGGSSALDVVDTACGRLLGGWCRRKPQHSLAAANLILLEAGGLLGTETGNPDLSTGQEQLFGSIKIFRQLLKYRSRLTDMAPGQQ